MTTSNSARNMALVVHDKFYETASKVAVEAASEGLLQTTTNMPNFQVACMVAAKLRVDGFSVIQDNSSHELTIRW